MKNLITLLITASIALFITSCSDDALVDTSMDSTQTVDLKEIDPETGEEIDLVQFDFEKIQEDPESNVIDLTEIIEEHEAKSTKHADGKSIATKIFDYTYFSYGNKWTTIKLNPSRMGYCSYNNYKVKVIPVYGDPDVSIWGYDHSRYHRYRKVRGATSYPGYGKEVTWFNRCDFYSNEEKGYVGVHADGYKNAKFRVVIYHIS